LLLLFGSEFPSEASELFNEKHAQQTAAPPTPLINFLRFMFLLLWKPIFAFAPLRMLILMLFYNMAPLFR
jgi:hypothetical protein